MRNALRFGSLVASALVLGGCAANTTWNSGDDNNIDSGTPQDTASGGATDPGTQTEKDAATQDTGTPPVEAGFDAGDGFDQFQHRNLDDVNAYRATLSIAPLTLDAQLCTFAYAGSTELSSDHSPHQHFITAGNDNTLWTSGFKTQAGENQGDPNGWYVMSTNGTTNELDQIDDIQKQMFNEGPGTGEAHGHYENMMNAKFKRLGVGLLEVSGEL